MILYAQMSQLKILESPSTLASSIYLFCRCLEAKVYLLYSYMYIYLHVATSIFSRLFNFEKRCYISCGHCLAYLEFLPNYSLMSLRLPRMSQPASTLWSQPKLALSVKPFRRPSRLSKISGPRLEQHQMCVLYTKASFISSHETRCRITLVQKRSRVVMAHAAQRLVIAITDLKRAALVANLPTTNAGRTATLMHLVGRIRSQVI